MSSSQRDQTPSRPFTKYVIEVVAHSVRPDGRRNAFAEVWVDDEAIATDHQEQVIDDYLAADGWTVVTYESCEAYDVTPDQLADPPPPLVDALEATIGALYYTWPNGEEN